MGMREEASIDSKILFANHIACGDIAFAYGRACGMLGFAFTCFISLRVLYPLTDER
jgi:hypothetical protein